MIEVNVDGFVVGYMEPWVYELLWPVIEKKMPDSTMLESLIEDGPTMQDLLRFVEEEMKYVEDAKS
tara:strand:- start:3147 stop:3344 length:198 start_codon:yes stop_codon:yes gene_type:complete